MIAIGVDIGSTQLTVCWHLHPIQVLDFSDPGWWRALESLIVPDVTIVAFEPTGWHYSSPLLTLASHLGARLLHVEHRISKRVRETRIGGEKNDRTDSQALALIAWEVGQGVHYEGVHFFDPATLQLAARFKFMVRAYVRARGRVNATENRLRQFAHSIWPSLSADLTSYLRAVAAGYVTPAELAQLAVELEGGHRIAGYEHGQSRRWFRAMIAKLPPWLIHENFDHIWDLIVETHSQHEEAERQRASVEQIISAMLNHPLVRRVVALWRTVPAASDIELAALLAATNCEPQHFTDDAFAQACRLNPVREQSGKEVRTRLTQRGHKQASPALHLWVMRLLANDNRPNPIAAYFDRRKAAGLLHTMAATKNKLAAILVGIARSGQPCNWNWKAKSEQPLTAGEEEEVEQMF